MTKKPVRRVKHVPQRTCVGCRETLPKRALIRVVRTTEGVRVDPTGKLAGRGAYLHDKQSCWERGLKGPLAHALKTELSDQDREQLKAFMNTLAPTPLEGEDRSHEKEARKTAGQAAPMLAQSESQEITSQAEQAAGQPERDESHG